MKVREASWVACHFAATVVTGCADTATSRPCACACVTPSGPVSTVDEKTGEALRTALQDERRAESFYRAVMARHGEVRPFANIVHAEVRHQSVVTAVMRRHGVEIPPPDAIGVPAVPDTLRECNRVAAGLERENIAMYDRLLSDVREDDVRTAFENLRAASMNNHLPAFEAWANR